MIPGDDVVEITRTDGCWYNVAAITVNQKEDHVSIKSAVRSYRGLMSHRMSHVTYCKRLNKLKPG